MIPGGEINTVRDLIDRMSRLQPDFTFLLSPDSGRVLTFKELQDQSRRLYGRFCQMGLQAGDKVAFLLDNGLSAAGLFLGAMYGGFVPVPLNVRAGISQLSYTLDHSDAKVIFVGPEYEELLLEIMAHVRRPLTVIPCDQDNYLEDDNLPMVTEVLPVIKADDAALLMYTSGSMGQPKGVVHTHKSILAHGRNSVQAHQLTSADRALLVLPLYHINAECVTLIPTLMSGGSVAVPHRFNVSKFWGRMEHYKCTWTALVPTIISQLLDWQTPNPENGKPAFQHIRFLRSSSAPLSPSLQREFLNKFKLPLIQAMGCTELGNVFSNPVLPGVNKIGSPGLPWGVEIRIINRQGVETPIGEPGEVLLRGDAMMQGYYKDPVGTAAALDEDGWFHTGDLAYRDADGYCFIVGRSKELIIKGGMNIAPKQVDEILEAHPAVREAAAVGIPDRYVGEDMVAFAVLRDGMNCDEKELLSFCEGRLGHFKTPTRIYFVEDLPKGPSGKVQRRRLVEEAARPTVAKSISLGNHPATSHNGANDSHNGETKKELPLDQIISEIWSDLLGQPHIDPHRNFFALGGHSLLAIQSLSRLREKVPVILSLTDFFENATIAQQAALARTRLMSSPPVASRDLAPVDPIPLRDRTTPCPLSPSQERLWFMEQLNPGAPVYNEVEAVRLKGKLDTLILEKALNLIIARHEILRSTIRVVNEKPVVIVHDAWPLKLKRINLQHLAPHHRQAEVERLLVEEPQAPYNLQAEPGIRATVIKLAAEEHIFILMMHHIICDWSSEGVLWRELSASYRDLVQGRTPTLPPLAIQHGDYAAWQRQQMVKGAYEKDLMYWEETLLGAPDLLELPADRPRPAAITYRGARKRFYLGPALVHTLRERSRQEKISLFTLFASALNTLLHRYTGSEDILFGVPLADRDRRELQSMIGFLLHVHALRTRLSSGMTFRELVARVQDGVLDLYDHRSPPFDQIVSRAQPERNVSHSPLVQVIFNWRDRDQQLFFVGMEGLVVESLLAETRTAKFDLTFIVTDDGDDICVEMEYNTDLFDEARIARMVGHYRTLLEAAVANPDESIGKLPLLTEAERDEILVKWNRTKAAYPREHGVHELFAEQVLRTPDAIAVAAREIFLTYRQLDERANQLAHYLIELGVRPDAPVGICMERSPEMIVGLLGILKAGGAYVPLDPAYPAERLAFMVNDVGARILLTQERLGLGPRIAHPACKILNVDAESKNIASRSTKNPANRGGADNIAYIIYTSGSTGEPKGVELTHGGLLNLVFWHCKTYAVSSTDKATQLAGVGFDASVWELWPYLTAGAAIYMPNEETRLSPEQLRNWLVKNEITLSFVPTPLAETLVGLEWPARVALRAMLTGGDRLTRHVPPNLPFKLINHYGPTENTVVTTCAEVGTDGQAVKAPSIGRPIANTQVYLLDKNLQPVPVGISGELCVAGDGLARGYLNRPSLTAERFITSSVNGKSVRLYKTGDLARYLPNGDIEFIGRNDDQVKIRGFRIELGEIETVLTEHPGIGSAVVVARENDSGDKRLIAYLIKDAPALDVTELREHLKAKMPDYMVPSAFAVLEGFPLTSNGKVDRAALPDPDDTNLLRSEAAAAPMTEIEKNVADILASLLKLDSVDVNANFFDLGGHSLLGTQLIARIGQIYGIELPLRRVFESPTVAELSAEIEKILVAEIEAMSEEEAQQSLNEFANEMEGAAQ